MKKYLLSIIALFFIFSLSAWASEPASEISGEKNNSEMTAEGISVAESAKNSSQEDADWTTLKEICVQIGDRTYDAILYDNAAGRFMEEQLPYTVHLNKGQIDYCGTTELVFEGKGFDSQEGHVKGELLYFDHWFVIFLNEQLPLGETGPMIPFGKIEDPADADDMLANAVSLADVTIFAKSVEQEMKLKIGDREIIVAWEENESVEALQELVSSQPLTISMSMYGGFEQVGPIGTGLPRNDVQTTTAAGDIVLYSGSQIVVFYGSNSWAYTRLGKIQGLSETELAELLGNGNVTLTISIE